MDNNGSPPASRHGLFMIDPEVIERLLGLPEGHSLIGARWDDYGQSIVFMVAGPDIPASAIGAPGPARLNLVMNKRADGQFVSHFEARRMRIVQHDHDRWKADPSALAIGEKAQP